MQANGLRQQHNHTTSYQSNSSAGSFNYGHERLNSLSRSESRSSRTQYEDFTHTPSPKVMTDYARNSLNFDFDQPSAEQHGRPRRVAVDPVGLHLLVETAVTDSVGFDVMSIEELEELKKEEAKLSRQVPGLRRELALETKYRDAAHGFNKVDPRSNKGRGSGRMSQDEYAASVQKCDHLSNELYRSERRLFEVREQRLRHTAGVLQMDHERRHDPASFNKANGFEDSDDWDSGFSLTQFAPGGLVDTEDGIMDIPLGHDPHVEATLRDLWPMLNSNDELLGRDMSNRAAEEEFSIDAFSEKVQLLCSRAAELSYDLDNEREERHVTESAQQENRAALMSQLQAAKEKHEEIHNEHQSRVATLEQDKTEAEARHAEVEAEMIRLQTEMTIAKAELEGAYGTRAQRQAEQAAGQHEINEATTRIETLQKELRDLVTEHEALTQQGIEAEKEREKMEAMIDTLREKLETVEVKLHDERVHRMGRGSAPASAVSTPASGGAPRAVGAEDATSLRVMRSEFKKMMREARAEHFRGLKAEQDERRRLEGAIRSLKKDAGVATTGPNSPSTMLSPPPVGRSGLGRNVSNA